VKAVDNRYNFPKYPKAFLLSQLFLLDDILLEIDIVVGVGTKVIG
jgi:hypothetical protein